MNETVDIVVVYDTKDKKFKPSIDGIDIPYAECSVGVSGSAGDIGEATHYAELLLEDWVFNKAEYKGKYGLYNDKDSLGAGYNCFYIFGVLCGNVISAESKASANEISTTNLRVLMINEGKDWIK